MENITTETELLAQVLRIAPHGAVWVISNDSWEEILKILSGFIAPIRPGEWAVEITESNRDYLVESVFKFDLGCKIIHTSVVVDGTELLSAFDAMSTVSMDESFYKMNEFDKKFPRLEILF